MMKFYFSRGIMWGLKRRREKPSENSQFQREEGDDISWKMCLKFLEILMTMTNFEKFSFHSHLDLFYWSLFQFTSFVDYKKHGSRSRDFSLTHASWISSSSWNLQISHRRNWVESPVEWKVRDDVSEILYRWVNEMNPVGGSTTDVFSSSVPQRKGRKPEHEMSTSIYREACKSNCMKELKRVLLRLGETKGSERKFTWRRKKRLRILLWSHSRFLHCSILSSFCLSLSLADRKIPFSTFIPLFSPLVKRCMSNIHNITRVKREEEKNTTEGWGMEKKQR